MDKMFHVFEPLYKVLIANCIDLMKSYFVKYNKRVSWLTFWKHIQECKLLLKSGDLGIMTWQKREVYIINDYSFRARIIKWIRYEGKFIKWLALLH